ncbi:lipopolysaccharide biosynthesis protein [Myxococcota bacterium]
MTLDRSQHRYHQAKLTAFSGGLERALVSGLSMARLTLLVWTLSRADYGIYVAVYSVVGTASLLDFGLHYGVITAVAQSAGRDDRKTIDAIVSTAFSIYFAISVIALCLLCPLLWYGPLEWLLGLTPTQAHTARMISVMALGALLLAMPFRVLQAALTGLQKGYLASAIRSASAIAGMGALVLAVNIWRGNVTAIVAAMAGSDLVFAVLALVWVNSCGWMGSRLSLSSWSVRLIRPLMSTSITFLLTNVANLLRRTFAVLIISHTLGPEAVPAFSIPLAVFVVGLSLCDLVAGSLWPAFGEAATRGDWDWVGRAYKAAMVASLAIALFLGLLGAALGGEVLRIWLPKAGNPSFAVMAAFSVWLVSQSGAGVGAWLLNGIGRNPIVLAVVAIEGTVTAALMILVTQTGGGVPGIAWAMCATGLLGCIAINGFAVPWATQKRVCLDWGQVCRLAGVTGLCGGAAWLGEFLMGALPPLLHVLASSAAIGVVFALLVWSLGLTPDNRARVNAWLARRIGGFAWARHQDSSQCDAAQPPAS